MTASTWRILRQPGSACYRSLVKTAHPRLLGSGQRLERLTAKKRNSKTSEVLRRLKISPAAPLWPVPSRGHHVLVHSDVRRSAVAQQHRGIILRDVKLVQKTRRGRCVGPARNPPISARAGSTGVRVRLLLKFGGTACCRKPGNSSRNSSTKRQTTRENATVPPDTVASRHRTQKNTPGMTNEHSG